MIWAIFSLKRIEPGSCKLTTQRYCDEVLQPYDVPIMSQANVIVQDVNQDRIHHMFRLYSYGATMYRSFHGPTDVLWDELDRYVRQRHPEPQIWTIACTGQVS